MRLTQRTRGVWFWIEFETNKDHLKSNQKKQDVCISPPSQFSYPVKENVVWLEFLWRAIMCTMCFFNNVQYVCIYARGGICDKRRQMYLQTFWFLARKSSTDFWFFNKQIQHSISSFTFWNILKLFPWFFQFFPQRVLCYRVILHMGEHMAGCIIISQYCSAAQDHKNIHICFGEICHIFKPPFNALQKNLRSPYLGPLKNNCWHRPIEENDQLSYNYDGNTFAQPLKVCFNQFSNKTALWLGQGDNSVSWQKY